MRFKGKKPIASYDDTYNLDSTLSPIIAEGLKKYKEVIMDDNNCAGYPLQVVDDEIEDPIQQHSQPGLVPDDEHGVARDPDYDKMEDEYFKKWIDVIDKMIYAFDSDEPEVPDGIFGDSIFGEPDENGNREWHMNIKDQDKYDKHRADEDQHWKRVDEGLELFAKYYRNLWW